MRVSEIMSKTVRTCSPASSLADVAKLMLEEDCGAIPVVEGENGTTKVVGIITDRDITIRAVAQGKNPLKMTASDCMTTPVKTVREDMALNECTDLMEREQIRRIPVVGKSGKVVGIVAQADIARSASIGETAEFMKDISRPGH